MKTSSGGARFTTTKNLNGYKSTSEIEFKIINLYFCSEKYNNNL